MASTSVSCVRASVHVGGGSLPLPCESTGLNGGCDHPEQRVTCPAESPHWPCSLLTFFLKLCLYVWCTCCMYLSTWMCVHVCAHVQGDPPSLVETESSTEPQVHLFWQELSIKL